MESLQLRTFWLHWWGSWVSWACPSQCFGIELLYYRCSKGGCQPAFRRELRLSSIHLLLLWFPLTSTSQGLGTLDYHKSSSQTFSCLTILAWQGRNLLASSDPRSQPKCFQALDPGKECSWCGCTRELRSTQQSRTLLASHRRITSCPGG